MNDAASVNEAYEEVVSQSFGQYFGRFRFAKELHNKGFLNATPDL